MDVLRIGYWTSNLLFNTIFVSLDRIWLGVIITPFIFLAVSTASLYISKLPFKQWYAQIFMCGVRKIGYSFAKLSRAQERVPSYWEPYFVFYFGFLVKFFIPWALWFLLIGVFKADIAVPYSGYALHW